MWLAYLVPWFVNRRQRDVEEVREAPEFPETMTVVHEGGNPVLGRDEDEAEVSTPFTRSWTRRDMRRAWARAAQRRRTTLLVLLATTVLAAVLAIAGVWSWWVVVAGAVLVVAFLVVARVSVVSMGRAFDRRLALVERGWDEETVVIDVTPFRRPEADHEATEYSVELSGPVRAPSGSLWEAVPVTAPTYVSTPLVARTVRTIDLSAPGPALGHTDSPVTAQAPVDAQSPAVVEEGRDAAQEREASRESGSEDAEGTVAVARSREIA